MATTKSKTRAQKSSTSYPGKRKRSRDEDKYAASNEVHSSRSAKQQKKDEEKRLKTFRTKAPQSFLLKMERAQSQRMIVIGRTRSGSGLSLQEDIDIVGSTGNIYTVTVGRLPACTCPDHQKGNECKHKVYALHTVLKAPEHLQYQRAYLSNELSDIFSNAPPIPNEDPTSENADGTRKPVEGECPICYMDMDGKNEELVWCKAACGNNTHKSCFDQWAASQCGQTVKCVYCRAEWQLDHTELRSIKHNGSLTEEGFVNVAEQFGISRARDYSSYYQPWARRQFGYG